MDDTVSIQDNKIVKMGVSSNVNVARIATLQERKKQIENTLAQRNQELRQLCIQEAELTGVTPSEMPLEPGETLPLIRRRVKTAFELPENLVVNANKDTSITNLELQIQLHANLAEAALGLASEHNVSKTVKRQHRAEYQKHKNQCIALQEKLALLNERAAEEYKQKKKARTPEQKDDTISVNTNFNNPFHKSDIRHSVRSVKQNLPSPSESCTDQRCSHIISTRAVRNSDISYSDDQPLRQEEIVNSGFYRLSLNGYNKYMERREKLNSVHPVHYNTYSNFSSYNSLHNSVQQHNQQRSPHFQQNSPHTLQPSLLTSHYSLHSEHGLLTPHHNFHLSQQSHHFSQHNTDVPQQLSPQLLQYSPQLGHQRSTVYHYSNYTTDNKFNHLSNTQLHRRCSPPIHQKSQYYPSPTLQGQPNNKNYQTDDPYKNHHQIQPHQQYEHIGIMTMGLGGCWKKSESGELVWYNANTGDVNWQKDKRFGSLDRRKNKRVHKRISPSVEHNSSSCNCSNPVRSATVKSQITSRQTQDNVPLVRTQSLGSVGIHTVDSVFPSDDNSSCEGDNHSINDVNQIIRKHKEKEWLETSLDGPISPQTLNSSEGPGNTLTLSPKEKYVVHSPSPPSATSKPVLEIPAETNPSPRVPKTNVELFSNNNNMPKNCTIVQAGHCKPYHEETKPFEMSDFYKYSTKYKKVPSKGEDENSAGTKLGFGKTVRNSNETFEGSPNSPSTFVRQQTCKSNAENLDNVDNLNTSIDLSHVSVSDHFSAEMNAWFKEQKNNNDSGNVSQSRSSATLV